jgi:hypothetical protein
MPSIPAHVLQVRSALLRASEQCRPDPWAAAVAWLQNDVPQPVNGYVFRLETERTPLQLGGEPRWRYVLLYSRISLEAHDFEWKPLLQVEA